MSEQGDHLDQAIADMVQTLGSAGIWIGADRDGNVVTLTGAVDSTADRNAAIDVARATVMRAGARVIDALEAPDATGEMLMAEEQASRRSDWMSTSGAEPRDPDRTARETDPDFTDDLGSTDPMLSASEGMPWFPPTDPVVGPSDDYDGLQVLNGFAPTGNEPNDASGGTIPDDLVTRRVLRALADDALTTDLGISAYTHDGVVHLHGEVPTLDDAESAEAVAADVEGVIEVREALRVRSLRDRA